MGCYGCMIFAALLHLYLAGWPILTRYDFVLGVRLILHVRACVTHEMSEFIENEAEEFRDDIDTALACLRAQGPTYSNA